MKVETKGHTTVVRSTEENLDDFISKFTMEQNQLSDTNLIVDVNTLESLTAKHLSAFLPLSKKQLKLRRSFVVVANVDFNEVSDKLSVVPTLQEAHDIIEMEEIERDLGF